MTDLELTSATYINSLYIAEYYTHKTKIDKTKKHHNSKTRIQNTDKRTEKQQGNIGKYHKE